MLPITQYSFLGDVNIGNHALVTDSYALVPEQWKTQHTIPHTPMSVANTSLLGLCVAGNSNAVIVPNIAHKEELQILEDYSVAYTLLDTAYTCLGNMICANDYGALIGHELQPYASAIEKTLDVPVWESTIAGLSTVGSCCVATNNGFLAHRAVSTAEMDKIKKALRVGGGVGSINCGSPFIRSGIIANSYSVVIGDATTGPELTRIQETLCIERGD